MNNERRAALGVLQSRSTDLATKASAFKAELEKLIDDGLSSLKEEAQSIHDDLEALKDEEQEYYEAMPEGFQNGEKGQAASEAVNAMEEGMSALGEIADFDLELDDMPFDKAEEAADHIASAFSG